MNHRIGRRTFLQAGAAAAASLGAGRVAPATDQTVPTIAGDDLGADVQTYREPARDIPIAGQADVFVCGGGPAGVSAALAAARAGAKTRLVEVHGCLGGIWTAGLLVWILNYRDKPGMMQVFAKELERRGAARDYGGALACDVEVMKLMLEDLCEEAGVEIMLHTRVAAAAVDDQKRLRLAVTESKSGRRAYAGKVFIDATGDADLAVQAGCGWDFACPETGRGQPMSLIVLFAGVEIEQIARFVRGWSEPRGQGNPKMSLLAELRRAGVDPSYSTPAIFYLRDGLFCMMANHEYGVRGFREEDVTAATLRARAENHRMIDALRSLGGPWKNIFLCATAEQIGVRESRRVHGLYTVSTKDLVEGARHEDAVCRVNYPVNVHSIDPTDSRSATQTGLRAKPYDIPLRALIARDVEGLMMAGRCISGDFIAHSSYRVTGNAVALGEAAGAAAAVAAQTGRLPQEVPWPEIAAALGRGQEPE
jgi:hypothetical protein